MNSEVISVGQENAAAFMKKHDEFGLIQDAKIQGRVLFWAEWGRGVGALE